MSPAKPWMPQPDDPGGLEAAKERLMGESEISFDVDKILAENRLKQDKKKERRKEIEERLEKELAAARMRGNRKRAEELEKEKSKLQKEESHELATLRRTLDEEKKRVNAKTERPTLET
jgi:hypothetical protein